MTRSAIGDMANPPKPPMAERTKEAKELGLTSLKRLQFSNIQKIHKELADHMMFLLSELNTKEIIRIIIDDVKKEKMSQSELEDILGACLSRLILLEEEKNLFLKYRNYVFDFLSQYQNLDTSKTNQGRKSPLYDEAEKVIHKTLSADGRLPTNSELEIGVKKSINSEKPDSVAYVLRTASKHLKKFKEKRE